MQRIVKPPPALVLAPGLLNLNVYAFDFTQSSSLFVFFVIRPVEEESDARSEHPHSMDKSCSEEICELSGGRVHAAAGKRNRKSTAVPSPEGRTTIPLHKRGAWNG